MQVAMARAEEKYGPHEWRRWRFPAELCSEPAVLRTVRYIWTAGLSGRRQLQRRELPPTTVDSRGARSGLAARLSVLPRRVPVRASGGR